MLSQIIFRPFFQFAPQLDLLAREGGGFFRIFRTTRDIVAWEPQHPAPN